jgi:predicted TIM-barrel fold metal-dependent hydrolase
LYGLEPLKGMPAFVADFLLDTTRAAARLGGSGTLDRCPNLKIILSHSGGFVPFAAYRIAGAASPKRDFADGMEQLKKFYFDLAISGTPAALPSLLTVARPDHVLFATDWPYATDSIAEMFTSMYEGFSLSESQRAAIDRSNAEALFPRLRGGLS